MPGLHPHELRHTAASLAIAYGADIKVVQQMLGHASATMTMDTYGHLFENRLDEVADALDAAGSRCAARTTSDSAETTPAGAHAQAPSSAVAPVLPKERLVDLDTHQSPTQNRRSDGF